MGVAEGVDVEDVEVGGREEEVLHEGGDHVPGVEEEDAGDKVKDVGASHGDDEGKEDFVREEQGEAEAAVLGDFCLHAFDGDED